MYKRVLVFIILIVFLFTGCENYNIVKEDSENYPIISPFPDKEQKEIILYYPDIEYDYLITEFRKIEVEEGKKIEEIVMREFLKGPKTNRAKTLVPKGTELISIDVINGVAYISFTDDLINKDLSEKDEALLLYSIVNTITEIKDIMNVQILIEGRSKKIFCNHYKIDRPLHESRFLVNRKYVSPLKAIVGYYNGLKNQDYGLVMEYMKIVTDDNLDKSIIGRYIENKYKEIWNYRINDYIINKYDVELSMEVDMSVYYYNSNERYNYKEKYNLEIERDKFVIIKELE